MSGHYTTTPELPLRSGEALARQRLARKNASGAAVYADAGEMPLGPVLNYVPSGDDVTVALMRNWPGTMAVIAGDAIDNGAKVYTANDGKVSMVNTGILIGTAEEAASGDGSEITVMPDVRRVPIVNTAPSTVIGASSTAENTFDVSATVPASELKAGTVLRIVAAGTVVDQNSTNTLAIKLKLGTVVVATLAALDVEDNDQFHIAADVVIRSIGANGTLYATVVQAYDAAGANVVVQNRAEATIDTTAGIAVTLTGQFSASHADNQVRLDLLSVEHRA